MPFCAFLNPRQMRWNRLSRAALADTAIIVGLGNPGPRYADTRHNVGWRVLDLLARQIDIPVKERRPKAVLGMGYFANRQVVLAKPRTFMNNSGEAVEYLLARFGGGPSNLLIIYDEMALLPGRIRLRASGSDAGHNGIRSIISAVGGTGFPGFELASALRLPASWPATTFSANSQATKRKPLPGPWSVRLSPSAACWKRTLTRP